MSGTAGAPRVHVRGEKIVASAQRGNRQAGTHACAGGWRNKERNRKREKERNERRGREEKKRERERREKERDTDVENIVTNYTSRSLTPRLLEETKENETRV